MKRIGLLLSIVFSSSAFVACTSNTTTSSTNSSSNSSTTSGGSTTSSGTTGGGGITCPTNFVAVPALAGYTSTDFCVAKYEMKDVSGTATSTHSGLPWLSITRTDAATECTDLGTGYDLLTNDEWQTMARNIEGVAANWSNATIGDVGGIARGNHLTDGNYLAASSDDNNSCFGTGNTCDLTTWDATRRVLILSNNSRIWDLAGNAWELIKDTVYPQQRNPSSNGFMYEVTNNAPYTSTTKDMFGPLGDYTSHSSTPYAGLGYFFMNVQTNSNARGGRTGGQRAGIFATDLEVTPSGETSVGFRCAYHP